MTEFDTMRARAEALHLHGLVSHWPEVATEAWVAPLLDWEETQRAGRSLERRRPALPSPAGNQVMSHAPEPLPAHLRPVTVEIPVTWTPEQALAVFELLDDLRERIWVLYNVQLQDLLREQQQAPGLDDSDDTLPPTQSAPFI
jgi:hypothetical protein